jgi:hypothetical protein
LSFRPLSKKSFCRISFPLPPLSTFAFDPIPYYGFLLRFLGSAESRGIGTRSTGSLTAVFETLIILCTVVTTRIELRLRSVPNWTRLHLDWRICDSLDPVYIPRLTFGHQTSPTRLCSLGYTFVKNFLPLNTLELLYTLHHGLCRPSAMGACLLGPSNTRRLESKVTLDFNVNREYGQRQPVREIPRQLLLKHD